MRINNRIQWKEGRERGRRERWKEGSQSVLRMSFAYGGVEVVTYEGGVPSHGTLEGKTGIVGRCREFL